MIPTPPEAMSAAVLVTTLKRFAGLARLAEHPESIARGLVPLIEAAFLHADDAPRRCLLSQAKADARFADLLVTEVFTDVARSLETGWNDDHLSFVDVTIASTRLQDAIRILSRPCPPARDIASLLMIVPQWEQHGLPAIFATEKLRRLGAPTRLLSGLSTPEIIRLAARIAPHAVLISTSSYRSAARLPELVRSLRKDIPQTFPIIVGGPAMVENRTLCAHSGADLATSDLNEALRFCDFPLREVTVPVSAAGV
ncbi:B12-binding domain-containing protein [Jannaschia sp. 2305UL9-9]|uniref:cobalamin B12-binding domain-containing protein n=1 Tax=Jannaschia sp. 2305UL9-9 TaxID=3121638 RepID=UPI003529321E